MADLRWRKQVGDVEIVKLSVGPMDNNVYLLSAGGETVLIDGANEADAILGEVGPAPLTTVLQTHGHADHVVALAEIVDRTGAVVYAHPDDEIPVGTRPLADGDEIRAGGVRLDVLHTPGHTPGGVCFVLREGGETHLFSGDTLFPGGPGNTFGDAEAFATVMRSLTQKLFVLPDDTPVYPGHGADTTLGAERTSLGEWAERGW